MKSKELTPNTLSEKTKHSLKIRLIAGLIATAIIIPPIFLGDWIFFAFICAIVFMSFFELVDCGKRQYSLWLYIVTILIGYVLVFWPIFRDLLTGELDSGSWHVYRHFETLYLSILVSFAGAVLLFLMVIVDKNFTVRDACFFFTFSIIIALGIQSLCYVRFIPSIGKSSSDFNVLEGFRSCPFFIYVILGTFFTDIGAYFVGVFFGKHKLNERISPNKTVEGFFGGIFVSCLVSFGFALIMSACDNPVLEGYFDFDHWWNILSVSVCMPFFATLGDFVFSSVKRHYEIKDFGNVIPGHGGILDRLDSVAFVFLFVAIYTCIVRSAGTSELFL